MKIVAIKDYPITMGHQYKMSQSLDGVWRFTKKQWLDYNERTGDRYDDVIKNSTVLYPDNATGKIIIPVQFYLNRNIQCNASFKFDAPANGLISHMLKENPYVKFEFLGPDFTGPTLVIGEKYHIPLQENT